MADRPDCIVQTEDIPWEDGPPLEDKFASRYRRLGKKAGAERLGCALYEVPPGHAAFPMHCHYATEEAIYILAGQGSLRIKDQEVSVGAGDYIALPPGPDHAHQLKNTSDAPLRYLCLSADADPDIVVYPDSGKVGAFSNWDNPDKRFRALFKLDTQVGYFDGE